MFNLSSEERLKYWRRFRMDLDGSDTLQCLQDVATLWSTAPLSNQYFASDLPETWPTAWELINDNHYDDVGVALGIFYTILYSELFDKNDIIYSVYKLPEGITNTVMVQDYVLNYDYGQVISKEQIEIVAIFQYDSKDIDKQ